MYVCVYICELSKTYEALLKKQEFISEVFLQMDVSWLAELCEHLMQSRGPVWSDRQ